MNTSSRLLVIVAIALSFLGVSCFVQLTNPIGRICHIDAPCQSDQVCVVGRCQLRETAQTDSGVVKDAGPTQTTDAGLSADSGTPSDSGVLASMYSETVLADTPLAYWRLSDAAGLNTASDSSGNGVTGVFAGNPQRLPSGAIARDSNSAMLFSDTDYLYVATTSQIQVTSALSVEFWVKTTSANYGNVIASSGPMPPYPWFSIALNASKPGTLSFWDSDAMTYVVADASAPNDGAWHHVVITCQGATVTLYLDAQVLLSKDLLIPVYGGVNGNREIGKFAGAIDEFAIYGEALTALQVAKHFAAAK